MKSQTFLVLIFFLIYGCSANHMILSPESDISINSEPTLKDKKKEMIMAFNHLVAEEYLTFLEERKITPAIGNFGWSEIKIYWKEVPELNKLRNDFEVSDSNFIEFINQKDERIKASMENAKFQGLTKEEWALLKKVVYSSVRAEFPEEYNFFLNERASKLKICNIKTLEYIINDYEQNEKLFPISWIPVEHMKQIVNEEFIQNFSMEADGIKLILQKIEQ